MLGAGCWMLGVGCWILDTGYWILDTGYWKLKKILAECGGSFLKIPLF